ncbi:hypothetical protein AGABI1DRAFT_111417 [Agaricus bisporus var. burnettii JB137-S8]|uniref:Uncharacterized protein n=2 Tax=Agaricus bisporus var. burnettii TaxID=192524 RepID=K5X4R4_AGABU|nr:hypothetical protein AGABI2DRAFT_199812 [Agaricus bisporus var. bisporus H97]XP_007326749.1 uncharacterized protein AGABI1DRAFT_111417 [Agaricus bisporus var. burnettii JB137-S8]EKM82851.1 hypothetical protein AGABI1DRAFT_111417 [Agaricus bisporus var. burnettii JB137-S8]EKV50249.1 hypothetical protein AGABI2DRAFT_199812 [Agaricus bisporus var. bisporus H97]KAF7779096.1 hypothetical protein Agabi119p4_3441 [Agaricus bisporus var. burnettii]
MKASAIRLIRIIPRKALDPSSAKILDAPPSQIQELHQPTVLDLLKQQREEAGPEWPANIRLEPVVKKEAFKRVRPELRTRLKKLLKER